MSTQPAVTKRPTRKTKKAQEAEQQVQEKAAGIERKWLVIDMPASSLMLNYGREGAEPEASDNEEGSAG